MARKNRKDVLTIDPEFLGNAEMLASRVERMELRPTKHYYQVKFIGGAALAYRPRLRGGVWFIRSRINAHAVSRAIGRADDIEPADGTTVLSYEQALAEVRRIMAGDPTLFFAIRPTELLPHTLRVCPIGKEYTVGHALADYLEEKRVNGSPGAYRSAAADANAYIVGDLSSIACADLDIKRLRDWFRSLATRPLEASNFVRRAHNQPITFNDGDADRKAKVRANSVLITLKAALNLAWRDGRIESDAQWRRLQPYRGVRKARSRIVSPEEVEALLAAARPDLRKLILDRPPRTGPI